MLTPERLREIRTRCEKATSGEWEIIPQTNGQGPLIARRFETGLQMNPTGLRLVGFTLERKNSLAEDRANAAFIAHAREDVPDLLNYIAELEAEIGSWDDE